MEEAESELNNIKQTNQMEIKDEQVTDLKDLSSNRT